MLKISKNITPRFENFEIKNILDETLREGTERCMFSPEISEKIRLIENIIDTGIKDIVFGSGPNDPEELSFRGCPR